MWLSSLPRLRKVFRGSLKFLLRNSEMRRWMKPRRCTRYGGIRKKKLPRSSSIPGQKKRRHDREIEDFSRISCLSLQAFLGANRPQHRSTLIQLLGIRTGSALTVLWFSSWLRNCLVDYLALTGFKERAHCA